MVGDPALHPPHHPHSGPPLLLPGVGCHQIILPALVAGASEGGGEDVCEGTGNEYEVATQSPSLLGVLLSLV